MTTDIASTDKEKCTCVFYEPGLVSIECDNCKRNATKPAKIAIKDIKPSDQAFVDDGGQPASTSGW